MTKKEMKAIRDALALAEDVLSRSPFSTAIWPNGAHPAIGIDKIRDAMRVVNQAINDEGNMSEVRDFKTAVIASISSGVLFCNFGEMHEAAEYLMGHPIWTHHFANEELWREMQKTILEQCPEMPTDAPGITKDNWPAFITKLETDLGKIVKIRKGAGLTALLPYSKTASRPVCVRP